jgi:hypothetical protein
MFMIFIFVREIRFGFGLDELKSIISQCRNVTNYINL